MSNDTNNLNHEILALFSGQDSILTIPKLYIKITNNYEKAAILNQIVFYSNKSKLTDGWFYKSYGEWDEEIMIQERTLRRILDSLKKSDLIFTKTNKIYGKRVLMCKPNICKIIELIKETLSQTDKVSGVQELPQTATMAGTNFAPTGQSVRLQPDKVSVSIYTDDYSQMNLKDIPDSANQGKNNEQSRKDKNVLYVNAHSAVSVNTSSVSRTQQDIPDFSNRGKKRVVSDYKKDERFMRFYNEYPKKQDPRDAWTAFKSIVGDNDVLLQQIIEDIKLRKTTHTNWQDRQYIKYPAAYLLKGEYLSEIYNAEQEHADKRAKDAEKAKERTAQQDAASQQRAENERINNERKISDASAYQAVVRHAPSKATENALSGLRALLN